MNIKRLLWAAVPFLTLVFALLEATLGGGAFYALKTGNHLTHPAWDYIPSIGLGIAGPLCAMLVAFKVISDQSMDSLLRNRLRLSFWFFVLAYTTLTSIYVLGQPEGLTFTETLEKFGKGDWTPWLTYWVLLANFILPGNMLAAMEHDQRVENNQQQQDVQAAQVAAQKDLVDIVHTLRQVVCVKG